MMISGAHIILRIAVVKQTTRSNLPDECDIATLRNRISHHKPIFNRNLLVEFSELIRLPCEAHC
jgi:hypothetical protein